MTFLNRRELILATLSGIGATALYSRFGTLEARAAGETAPRFVFVVEGNGIEPVSMLSASARAAIEGSMGQPLGQKRWWYRDYQHSDVLDVSSPDLDSAKSLSSLGPDLIDQSTVVYGLSSKITGGGHSSYHGPLSSARTVSGAPGGITIDAHLARELKPGSAKPFDALRLGVGSQPLNLQTCAFAAGQPAPIIQDPSTAYDILFGAVGGGAAFARRTSMLQQVRADVAAKTTAFAGGDSERNKLAQYATAVDELIARQEKLEGSLATLQAVAPASPDDEPLYASGTTLQKLELQFDIASAALRGDLTDVVVIASATGDEFNQVAYPSISAMGRHEMHHQSGGSQAIQDDIHAVTGRHVDLIAKLARSLKSKAVGNGTLLDHTVIVYLSDNGEQHHSSASEYPILLLGGSALGLAPGGRTLVYPGLGQSEHRQLSNLWNTTGHLAGRPIDDFGLEGPNRVAPGPLAELLA